MSARGRKELQAAQQPQVTLNEPAIFSAAQDAGVQAQHERDLSATARASARAGGLIVMDRMRVELAAKCVEQYERLKEDLKEHGRLWVPAANGGGRFVSDIDTYCDEVLGMSARRIRQLRETRDTLGEDAFENSLLIGFGFREVKAVQRLPQDFQELVRSAVRQGDKAKAQQIMESYAAMAEKAAREAEKAAEAAQQLEERQRHVEKLQRQNASLITQGTWQPGPDDVAETERYRQALAALAVGFDPLDEQLRTMNQVVRSLWAEGQPPKAVRDRVVQTLTYFNCRFWEEVQALGLEREVEPGFELPPQRPSFVDPMVEDLTGISDNQAGSAAP